MEYDIYLPKKHTQSENSPISTDLDKNISND